MGLANVGSALFAGFPVAGSFSRTALNYDSGARSQLSSITTALLVVLTLLFLTPSFHYMPHTALAAVILVAVSSLVDLRTVRRAFAVCKADGAAYLITFAVTILVGVQEGILVGAAVALLVVIRRSAHPDITELGYVDDEDAFLGIRSRPEARTFPDAVIIRFDASLYYANVSALEDRLASVATDKPELRYIVIDCRGVNSIDVTAIDRLEEALTDYRSREVAVLFTHMKRPVRTRLRKAGWQGKFAEDLRYETTREALETAGVLRHRSTTNRAATD